MTTISDDNVVCAFPGNELPENPLSIERGQEYPHQSCSHDSVRVNSHQRTLHCVQCGAVLDPFDFVKYNARTITHAWTEHAYVAKQVREQHERLHDLKKDESRLRAIVKRLREKGDTVVTVRQKAKDSL